MFSSLPMAQSSLYRMTDQALDGRLDDLLAAHKAEGSSLDAILRDLVRKADGVIVSKQTIANWLAKVPEASA